MINAGAAGAAGAGAAAAMAQAIRAAGAIVSVDAGNFLSIIARTEKPLVIASQGGLFSTTYQYLSSYKGLAFHTKSKLPLELPMNTELIHAKKIWIPG